MHKTTVLIVLDGWGLGEAATGNPVTHAHLTTLPQLEAQFPLTSLEASGISVGLPWGEIGNSEVGHLTMGAGKVLYQHYPRITLALRDGSFMKNEALLNACAHAQKNNSAVHLVGLLSTGNTHAAIEHLQALIELVKAQGCARYWLHLFGDGKDDDPFAMPTLLEQLPLDHVATIVGRHYAMDREENWQLTKTTYDALMGIGGQVVSQPVDAVRTFMKGGLSEEFLPAIRCAAAGAIGANDSVVLFNYREDSMRQLASSLMPQPFSHFTRTLPDNLLVTTFTQYRDDFTAPVAFPADIVANPLGKILADAGKTQLRIAETYKYAHVTYFFNGYTEPPFENEYRVLIPSLSTAHPEEQPELQAKAITDRLIQALDENSFDFILVNYANADTIGHTGNLAAGIATVEVLDRELGRVLPYVTNGSASIIITGDHGNIERMADPTTGEPETQHDGNPVPCYLLDAAYAGRTFYNAGKLRDETLGSLADIAPTLLELMGMQRHPDMTGSSLLQSMW